MTLLELPLALLRGASRFGVRAALNFSRVAARLSRGAARGGERAVSIDWKALPPQLLPFADAASLNLPLSRLLRLSLFQVTVGLAAVLLNGALNRVMIVELGVSAWFVALLVGLPLVFAPLRALIGHRSDTHRSILGWRRTPYLWFGSLLQFGGFAIMPFALILLSGDQSTGPWWAGHAAAGVAFLMVGAGMHTVQTAGLALATDIAPEISRPRVVALLYMMLLVGMVVSALVFGALLSEFSQLRLIQLVQGAGAVTLVLNLIALWGQEPRRPDLTRPEDEAPSFREAWARLTADPAAVRGLVAVALGAAAFGMQDVLLEPYGGQVLQLGVGATTALTAILAGGSLLGFALAARQLSRAAHPYRLAGLGALIGIPGFCLVIFAAPLESAALFRTGAFVIGFGGGLFAVGTLAAAMATAGDGAGLAVGAWGAAQATAAGLGVAVGGALRDASQALIEASGVDALIAGPAFGYSVVYHLEILLLFATLAAIGPLGRYRTPGAEPAARAPRQPFGLAEFPS
ncbi:MAG: MFS transporter [Pseudomonadota bacterium]